MTYDEMKDKLKSRLKKTRYDHSVGVADTAARLAERFGLDAKQARLAGLLHDCARQYPNEQLIAEADRRGIVYGDVEKSMPLLLHGYIGAQLVKEEYGVSDEKIAQAIYRHTVGGANMTALDKIIYFADMIEPCRAYPGVEGLRELAENASLDEMVLAGLTRSIEFVLQKGHLIHPDTVIARNEILLKLNEKQ